MRILNVKDLKKNDRMIVAGGIYTVDKIRVEEKKVVIITEGGFEISRHPEATIPLEAYKTTEIQAKNIKPGDTVKDGILGGHEFTIEGVRLTATHVFLTTTKAETVHADPEEIFTKQITPAEDGEEAARKEATLFLEMTARQEELEESIKGLDMDISGYAASINEEINPIMETLRELENGDIQAHEITGEKDGDYGAFFLTAQENIGQALDIAKEMLESYNTLREEKAALTRVEDFILGEKS